MSKTRIVPIKHFSDGDPTHRPKSDSWKVVEPPTIYLEKLAELWLKARGEQLVPGLRYRLDKLPHGYELFGRPRLNNSSIVDKHLYGSPNQKFFDSPNRFAPHFLHLMRTGDNLGCPCTICASVSGRPLPIRNFGEGRTSDLSGHSTISTKGPTAKSTQNEPENAHTKSTVNNEASQPAQADYKSAPRILRRFIPRLEQLGTLDEAYEEPSSMDWRAEHSVSLMIDDLPRQPSYVPRVGELVLFAPSIEEGIEICREDSTQEFKLFDSVANEFVGRPQWQAGVVAQVAEDPSSLGLEDVLEAPRKSVSITYSGFRVEPLPELGSADKTLSKRYKYVPLNLIRPFIFWNEFTQVQDPHPTVTNALAVMASWSLVNTFHIQGAWPRACLLSKGVYLGSELIVIGDAVRYRNISSSSSRDNIDVLHITHIKLEFDDLDRWSTDFSSMETDTKTDANIIKTTMALYGKAYTLDSTRAHSTLSAPVKRHESLSLPTAMDGYTWYRLHPAHKHTRITFNLIIGRLFEAAPMLLWFPPRSTQDAPQQPSLEPGYKGTRLARERAKTSDVRIPKNKSFYWGESRGDCLDIHELNGVALSQHDPERTEGQIEDWNDSARLLAQAERVKAKMKAKMKGKGALTTKKKPGPIQEHVEDDSETEPELEPERHRKSESSMDIDEVYDGPASDLPRKSLNLSKYAFSEPSAAPSADENGEESESESGNATDNVLARFALQNMGQKSHGVNAARRSTEVSGDEDESDELGGDVGARGMRMEVDSDAGVDVRGKKVHSKKDSWTMP